MTAKPNRRIILKSRREIELMRQAGALVSQVLDQVGDMVKPGVTTGELNQAAEALIAEAGAEALFKGVVNPQARIPFPAALCTSINDEVVHGIPSERKLVEGDILSVDCGVRLSDYCGDSARTFMVGQVAPDVGRLVETTRESLAIAIREIRPGRHWTEVAREIQRFVESRQMAVVREFVGHGIGREMHEGPNVPNYVDSRSSQSDFELVEGLVLAIEPMVNLGGSEVTYVGAERWTVATRDGSYAAHFEHTIAVTAQGAEVLTKTPG